MTSRIRAKWHRMLIRYNVWRMSFPLHVRRRSRRFMNGTVVIVILASNLTFISFLSFSDTASALSSGPEEASASGDCVQDTSAAGTETWGATVGNAFSNNGTYASVSVDGTASDYIKCTNYGFSIATGSTIDGIVVSVERKSDSTGNGGSADAAMRIVKGGTIGSTDRSTATAYTTSDVSEDHGGTTDLWGETWAVADINASNFGAAFSAQKGSGGGAAHTVTVDVITVTVYYTPPASNPTYEQSSYRWFNNANSTDVGTALNSVAQNTATTAPAQGTPFRLRFALHVTGETANTTALALKLQYAEKSGTCDTSFVGENYSDVTTVTSIAFYNNATPADGATATGNASDPTHSGHTKVMQQYNESGNFNVASDIVVGNDGVWDMALVDDGAYGGTAYCFRVVYATGSTLNTYTVIPEITTQPSDMEQSAYRWFQNSDSVPGKGTWAQTLGGTASDVYEDVAIAGDGSIIAVGQTSSLGDSSGDILLVKYGSSGAEQWTKTLGAGASTDRGYSVIVDSAGDYVITGSYGSNLIISKFNSAGTEQWSKTWGSGTGHSLVEDSSGGYVVAGDTSAYGAGSADIVLIKFDSSGVEQWSKTWGSTGAEYAYDVIEDSLGNFIVVGQSNSYTAAYAATLIKFNSSGVEQWSKTWGGASQDIAYSVIEDSSGDFVITGATETYDSAGIDLFIAKFNSSGVEQWSKSLGTTSSDYGRSIIEKNTGNYVVAGDTFNYGAGGYDAWLVEFNTSGVEQWTYTLGGSSNEFGYSLAENIAGSLVMAGYSTSFGLGNNEAFISLHGSDGSISTCGACASQTISETNRTVTEVDRSVTESNQSITETNQSYTEADEDPQTLVECGSVFSFASVTDGGGADVGRTVAEDTLGNIYVGGQTTSYGAGGIDAMVVKYNSNGVEQWTYTWGGAGTEIIYGIAVDNNGDIVATGHTASFGNNRVFILQIDPTGTLNWDVSWGGTTNDYSNAIAVDSNNDYIVVGETETFGTADDVFVAKFDDLGAEVWTKTLGGANQDLARSVVLDSSNNIYLTGESTTWTTGLSDTFVMKLDSSGVEQWTKSWGGASGNEKGYDIAIDSSGNLGVIGYAVSTGFTTAGGADFFLAVFNSSGVEQWSRSWGGAVNDFANAVAVDADGTWYITGEAESLGYGSEAASITAINSSGTELWTETYSGEGSDLGRDIIFAADGDMIVTGEVTSWGGDATDDILLVKGDPVIGLCGGVCKVESVTVGTITTTETDRAVTEVDRTVTEGAIAGTHTSQTEAEERINEVAASTSAVTATPLAAQDTGYTLPRGDEPLRLRLLLNSPTSPKPAKVGTLAYKLQVSPRSGTCDTSFTGESYTDISSSTDISFYNNLSISDDTDTGVYTNDPTYNSLANFGQSYEEANNFDNNIEIGSSQLAYIWDFALSGNVPDNGTYCVRAVESDGSLLSAYNIVVEITFPAGTKQLMRHGKYFDAETETRQLFYW